MITYATGMSQPAFDVRCDYHNCANYSREFVDTRNDARRYLARQGWAFLTVGLHGDYCPEHAHIVRTVR